MSSKKCAHSAPPLFPSPVPRPGFPLLVPVVTPQTQRLPLYLLPGPPPWQSPPGTPEDLVGWLVLQSGRPRSPGAGGRLPCSALVARCWLVPVPGEGDFEGLKESKPEFDCSETGDTRACFSRAASPPRLHLPAARPPGQGPAGQSSR